MAEAPGPDPPEDRPGPSPAALERTAHALGFGQTIPFDVPVEPSTLDMPTDPLEFGRAAAGFWYQKPISR